jgi:hypothetical protein
MRGPARLIGRAPARCGVTARSFGVAARRAGIAHKSLCPWRRPSLPSVRDARPRQGIVTTTGIGRRESGAICGKAPGLGPHGVTSQPCIAVLSAHQLMDVFAEAAVRGVRPSGLQRTRCPLGSGDQRIARSSACDGVIQPSVCRGRPLSSSAMASSSSWVRSPKRDLRGRYWRSGRRMPLLCPRP